MNGFRKNILVPLIIPVAATAIIVAVVFNVSRVLLWLEQEHSADWATLLAVVAAAGVLAAFAYFATKAHARRAGIPVLAVTSVLLVFAGGYGLGATEEGGGHTEEAQEHGEGTAPAGGTVNLNATEFAFDPKETTVPAGPVVFNLTNVGKVTHTVVLEGVPGFTKVVALKGASAEGKHDLEPGTYVFFCDEAGHRGAGMEGKLTVTEGGGGAGGGGGGGGSSTEITGTEFAFEPKEVTVDSAPVKITLKNGGKVQHTIVVEGVPDFTKIVAPKAGQAEGTLDAPAGSYVFFCDEAGHRGAGMEGKLTISGGGGGGGGSGGGAGAGEETTTDVVGTEFAFEPKEITAPPGTLKVNLKNEGKVVHTFQIEEIPEFGVIKAEKGATGTGSGKLTPGTYTFFCNEAGHRGAGMEGKLIIG